MLMKAKVIIAMLFAIVFFPLLTFAESPDFSKTNAANSTYDFSKNKQETGNQNQVNSTQHDFSKTSAAISTYDFSKNESAGGSQQQISSSQHDFSRTEASRKKRE